MARMIPSSGAREYDPRSREGLVYSALSLLDDSYTVVHSLSLVSVAKQVVKESEADFVIFKPDAGIICFEVKAGQVSYRDGEWVYSTGKVMKHGGPFNQAQNVKYRLMDEMRNRGLDHQIKKCRFYHAVWFPSIDKVQLNQVELPPECDKLLILTKEDLVDPSPALDRIFSLNQHREQNLTPQDEKHILERVLCPAFNVVPTVKSKYDYNELHFSRLLNSQIHVLDFLQEQQFAIINGIAGSGKTLIAIEQAKRKSIQDEKVLFLCYNSLLCKEIRKRCDGFDNIDVYTIDGFATKICGANDYQTLQNMLLESPSLFPYQHLVIDEGQDFGDQNKEINRSDILDTFKLIIEEKSGSFYMFYDKYQLVQGTGLPSFINDADCKLSLWVNCRNTTNIAKCSTGALDNELSLKVKSRTPSGSIPRLSFSKSIEEQIEMVDIYIEQLKNEGIEDIVILSCRTESSSIAREEIKGEPGKKFWKNTSIPFFTCRKFKGLEADAVVLIDISSELWTQEETDSLFKAKPGLLFYTGASRAKHELRLVCDMNKEDFELVNQAIGIKGLRKNPVKAFLKRINALE